MKGKANTSVFSNALIWLGASICITEMMAGTLFAPLGFAKGFLAVVVGHVLGCVLMYLAGLIGAKEEKSAMETTKIAFGKRGSYVFSICNVLQLVGWTAVMIVVGTGAANTLISLGGDWVWSVIIAALLLVWIAVGIKNVGYLGACLRDDYPYKRPQFTETTVVWRPLFAPDASQLTSLGDAILKIEQALPGYITEERIRELTGL